MAMSTSFNQFAFWSMASLIGLIGCGNGDRGTVTGTITLNGQPIGPGTIRFQPVDFRNSKVPSGADRFAEDGKYELETGRGKQGLAPGEYLVIIDGATTGNEREPAQKSNIPSTYLNPTASGLKAIVKVGHNQIDFDLTR